MFLRWIVPSILLILLHSAASGQQAGQFGARAIGSLAPLDRSDSTDAPYVPQAGDLVFFDDFNKLHHLAFKLSGTGGPLHVGMIVARRDGSLALFDITGSTVAFARVSISEMDARLHNFPGMVLVRQLKQPLTNEQSRDLTNFAYAQEGKRFAMLRVLLQGTPFSARTGLRHALFGHTYFDRHRWFCSEIVIAGCATAGLLNPHAVAGNAVFPRDLAYDEMLNLSHLYHSAARWVK
jgi:hypothetical protein